MAWCIQGNHGTRVIPDGAITGAHFVQTPDYVQVTGIGNLTMINIPNGDEGGELDPHGADGNGELASMSADDRARMRAAQIRQTRMSDEDLAGCTSEHRWVGPVLRDCRPCRQSPLCAARYYFRARLFALLHVLSHAQHDIYSASSVPQNTMTDVTASRQSYRRSRLHQRVQWYLRASA